MDHHSAMWDAATRDLTAENRESALVHALAALDGVRDFTHIAASHSEYDHRRALTVDQVRTVAGIHGADFASVQTALDESFLHVHAARRVQAAAADDDNCYSMSGVHHTSCGRWLGHRHTAAEHLPPYHPDRLHRAPDPSIEPVRHLIEGARAYSSARGLDNPHPEDHSYLHVVTNPDRILRIARAYDAAPEHDPGARGAFGAMRDQIHDQYHHLTGPMGIRVHVTHEDPYPDVAGMVDDIRHNKQLKVLSTAATGGHPFFSDDENDKFRAVHDAFGHAATGRGFDRHGEEAAWLTHSKMFSGDAKHAMTTETRGQNSALIASGLQPPQKLALLPRDLMRTEAARRTGGSMPNGLESAVADTGTPADSDDPDRAPGDLGDMTTAKTSKPRTLPSGSAPAPMPPPVMPGVAPAPAPMQAAASLHVEAMPPKFTDPADHPFFKGDDEHEGFPVSSANVLAHWAQANEEEKAQGKRWYPDAHLVAKALGNTYAGGDTGKAAGVLSAYSPRATWQSNLHNATRSLAEGRALGVGEGVSIMGVHQNLASRIMEGEHYDKVLKGPKTNAFATLIHHGGVDPETGGYQPHVVIDRHALSVAAGKRLSEKDAEKFPSSTPHYYNHVAKTYTDAAKALGDTEGRPVAGHEVQAVTWLVRKRLNREEDLASKGGGGKGRVQNQDNHSRAWQQAHQDLLPDLGENMHTAHAISPEARMDALADHMASHHLVGPEALDRWRKTSGALDDQHRSHHNSGSFNDDYGDHPDLWHVHDDDDHIAWPGSDGDWEKGSDAMKARFAAIATDIATLNPHLPTDVIHRLTTQAMKHLAAEPLAFAAWGDQPSIADNLHVTDGSEQEGEGGGKGGHRPGGGAPAGGASKGAGSLLEEAAPLAAAAGRR